MKLATGEKFARFAFSRCAVGDDFPDELPVGNGLVARRTLGLDIGRHWPGWLGSLVMDGENLALTRAVDYIWYGLLLQGVPNHMEGFTLTGANVGGEIQVRQFGRVRDYQSTYEMPEVRPDAGALRGAMLLADRLRHIDVQGSSDWGRLRRGLRALFRGSRERDLLVAATPTSCSADSGRLQDGGGPDRAPPTAAASVKADLDRGCTWAAAGACGDSDPLVPDWFQCMASEAVYEHVHLRTAPRYHREMARHACRWAVPGPDS